MLRGGREVHYQTKYIMGTYRCMFQNAAVLDAWYKTHHYLVLGYLRKTTPTAHSQDLRKQTRFPTKPLMTPDGVDCLFTEVLGGIFNPPCQELSYQSCISPETWHLINTMIAT